MEFDSSFSLLADYLQPLWNKLHLKIDQTTRCASIHSSPLCAEWDLNWTFRWWLADSNKWASLSRVGVKKCSCNCKSMLSVLRGTRREGNEFELFLIEKLSVHKQELFHILHFFLLNKEYKKLSQRIKLNFVLWRSLRTSIPGQSMVILFKILSLTPAINFH